MPQRKKRTKARIFIAVKLPDKLKKELGKLQRRLDSQLPAMLRFVQPDQLHLTLAFLGPISPEAQKIVIKICQAIAQQFTPFSVYPTQLGTFPRLARPSVIWIGLGGQTQKLLQLINQLETQLCQQNILPIRGKGKITPHLTLARVQRKRKTRQLQPLRSLLQDTQLQLSNLIIPVQELIIYQSNLHHAGPKHIPIATIGLTKSSSSAAGPRGN